MERERERERAREILEKAYECNLEIDTLFVYFKQAICSICRHTILEILQLRRIAIELKRLTNMTLEDLQARVVIENYLIQSFDVNVAVRNGDALLVSLSNLVMDCIIRGWGGV